MSRSVILLGPAGSSLIENPTAAYWEATGCADKPVTKPASLDSVLRSIKEDAAREERRQERAAAKGIKLCDQAAFLASPAECMRRGRLADAP